MEQSYLAVIPKLRAVPIYFRSQSRSTVRVEREVVKRPEQSNFICLQFTFTVPFSTAILEQF